MSVNDLVIEFIPEDPDSLEIEIGYNSKVPSMIQDFIPRQKFMDQQIKLIQERGLINRHKSSKADHPAPAHNPSKDKNINKETYILMICKKDHGTHNVKASIYPYLLGDKKENRIEFTFKKDCQFEQINSHLEINHYTDEYKYGVFRDGILIDTIDPQIQIKVNKGNQFIHNPTIKKISGKPSNNIVQLKKNIFGGLIIGPYRNLDMYVISKCKDEVGEEKWQLTLDFPPYDQQISFVFKTQCGNEQVLNDFTDLPLLIGTDEQKGNVLQFGIVNQSFELDEQLLQAGNVPRIYQQTDRDVKFNYSLQPSDIQDETVINISAPILTYDESVVKIFYQFPIKGEIDIENQPQLKIHMRCQKVGQTYIEIYQTIDIPDKGLKKYPIEYGFLKKCSGFDYDYDKRSQLKNEGSFFEILKYAFILIGLIIVFLGIKLVVPRNENFVPKNIQLPTRNTQYSKELQGNKKDDEIVFRKRFEN
ncbi:hypothetical protein PPERSA_11317 [Pseudocohnilembus persalinus]|uniref:Uncharacterized protein n=1 Tax=Pseudocohnilembus persalinus TaxID=266149 RepID=A0A0V0QPU7_PSEPJ|nr:hypothetical protein PPERSA_11317 [Pseudocohnilembus persalinus]|eukprot:KRX04193.1 hypothetical protein PPERSA_11317 [Pseudocohnilembus persalinus]